MSDQFIISSLFMIMIFLFIWGKLRYDAVSLIMLAIFVILGFIEPHKALSDPLQQLRPYDLDLVYRALEHRDEAIDDERYIAKLEELRYQIDQVDAEILKLISRRQDLAKAIGPVKYENQATIFQMKRWFKVLENRKAQGLSLDLEDELVHELFQLLHKYSIDTQIKNHHE